MINAAFYLVIFFSGVRATAVDHIPMASLEACERAAQTVKQGESWVKDVQTFCVRSEP